MNKTQLYALIQINYLLFPEHLSFGCEAERIQILIQLFSLHFALIRVFYRFPISVNYVRPIED